MFQKAYRKLTLLCILLITFILTTITLIYLFVSERSLRKNEDAAFLNDMNTVIYNLEINYVMSSPWLHTIENNGKYMIWILDNNIPLWINNPSKSTEKQALFEEVMDQYQEYVNNQNDPNTASGLPAKYYFTSRITGQDYYIYANCIETFERQMDFFVLFSQENLNGQILRQRITFFIIDLTVIIILSLFASFFCKRILIPIEVNQREKTRFIASASHELRTPVSVILSSVNACKIADETEKENFLGIIESESRRISRLISDMLTLAGADNHSWTIQKAQVNLDTLLLNCYEAFEPLARDKNQKITVTIPEENIPLCCCDPERITQVISILLHNAISYSPENTPLQLCLETPENIFRITVTDHGPGIPDSEKEKVFERFYRSDVSRNKKDHFGLGLCIAREIMQAHQGTIKIKDTDGGGSTFVCQMP